jgi:hypothetical protein
VSFRKHRTIPLLVALAAAGCQRAPEFRVHGVNVVVDSIAPFALRPDLPPRVESTIQVALEYWGGSWRDLDGRTLTLVGDTYVECEGRHDAVGCFDGDLRVATRDVAAGTYACVEQTSLVHEVGHAILGDPLHEDPRWMQLEAVAAALSGRPGYAADGEVPCVRDVSGWRHPLGRP